MRNAVDFIYFAVKQAKEAEQYGFKRNVCSRNLKIAIEHYWRKVHLKDRKKEIMRRSIAATKCDLGDCDIEHAVPLMVLVNKLMNKRPLTKKYIFDTLLLYYRVVVVTKTEHRLLNSSGLTSKMPKTWNCKNIWARYSAVGIKLARKK
jgi:hypothetical protein